MRYLICTSVDRIRRNVHYDFPSIYSKEYVDDIVVVRNKLSGNHLIKKPGSLNELKDELLGIWDFGRNFLLALDHAANVWHALMKFGIF